MSKKWMAGLAVVLVAGGAGVMALGGMSWIDEMGLRGEERRVRSRMEGYWQARVAEDVDKMSKYAHPAQPIVPQPGTLITEAFEIEGIALDGERAVATTKIRTHIKHTQFTSKSKEITLEDPWVRFDGTWYREPRPTTLQDMMKSLRGEWVPPTIGAAPSAAETENDGGTVVPGGSATEGESK